MRKAILLAALLVVAVAVQLVQVRAQVPVTVWGYVKMPDGSPAVGAKVTVKGGGASKTTTTDSSGKYKVTLTVSSVPVKVTVTAVKGSYKGSASKTGEGVIRIDVKLKKVTAPPPSRPKLSKKKTSLEISAKSLEVAVGEAVEIYGRITPQMKVKLTIFVIKPGGETSKAVVETGSDGSFTYTFVADVLGVWKVYAFYAGSEKYASSKSNVLEIRAKERASISVEARCVEPRKVVIEGAVTPPVVNATVMLFVSFDGGKTWIFLCNVTTGEGGVFRKELELLVGGNLLFKAVFPGTEALTSAETEKPPVARLATPEEEELRREVEELRAREEELTRRIEQLREEKSLLENKSKALEEELSKTREELSRVRGSLSELSSRLEELEREASEYRRKADLFKTLLAVATPAAAAASAGIGYWIGASRAKRPAAPRAKQQKRSERK